MPMFRCDVVWMCGSYQCLCADGSADGTILPTTGDEADNGESWVRAPTTFDGATHTIRHKPTHDACAYVAQSGNAQHPTCSTPRTAQAPTLGNRLPRRRTAMATAAMGVTPALPLPSAPGLNGLTPPTLWPSTETGLSSPIRTRGLAATPPHLRRDGRACPLPCGCAGTAHGSAYLGRPVWRAPAAAIR